MKCKFIKENNEGCDANAMNNSGYCYLHNPEVDEAEKLIVRSKGGKANKIKVIEPLDPIELNDPKDVVKLLADTINKVRSGELDLRVANCIGYLSGHLTKAFEVTQLSQRVELIERVVLTR